MLDARFLSIAIARPWRAVYDAFHAPQAFPSWAAGLSEAGLHREGEVWRAVGPGGPVTIRFTPDNPFGVMDHWVTIADGTIVYVPMRVTANGEGAEVTFTLFRQADMDDDRFAADAAMMTSDLAQLKALAEA